MRGIGSLFAVACVLVVCVSAMGMGVDESQASGSEETRMRVANSAKRLRLKIKRAQRVLSEIDAHQGLSQDVGMGMSAGAGSVADEAAEKSFVIGDVGSGGTRLFVYLIVGKDAKPMSKDACAQETQAVPTNLDLIYTAAKPQEKADQIVKHLLDTCVASVLSGAASTYKDLGLPQKADVEEWMKKVPMYYEATAGLRLLAQQIDKTSTGKKSIKTDLWDLYRKADNTWVGGDRSILLTRVIPGALEGWYGFRAGVVAAQNEKKFGDEVKANRLIYFEVGGASAQIVFTIPPPATDGEQVTINGNANVFAEVSAVAEAQTDAEATEALESRIVSGAGTIMNADQDMAVMSAAEGPVDLHLTSNQPQTPLIYSKSFLGNGMNRFNNAVLHKVLRSGVNTECSKRTHVPCIDNPCWRSFAVLTRGPSNTFAWDSTYCPLGTATCPDNKALQDLYDEFNSDWVAPGFEKSITRVVMGTDDFDKCIGFARQVWASKDEHVPAYSYYQQFKEVRAALDLATKSAQHKKTHVLVSVKSLETGKDLSNDHAGIMSPSQLRAFLRNAIHLRLAGPFTYHAPLVGAYFTSILFDRSGNGQEPADRALGTVVNDGGGFALSKYCADCKYGAWGLSWTVGAADFFVAYAQASQSAQEQYKAWEFQVAYNRNVPKTNPDIEDPHFTVCADFLDASGTVAQARTECNKGWQNRKACVLHYDNKFATQKENKITCAKKCTCVPAK